MPLTRKFLSALGIDGDKVDEIINQHQATLEDIKRERDTYKDKAESVDDIQKKLDDATKKLKAYEDSGDNSWEEKYKAEKTAKEKAENDLKDYKTSVEAEKALENKRSVYKAFLKEAGISEKRLDAVLKVTDLSKIELDKDNKIKDADDVKKSVQEEWKDFIVTQEEHGANVGNPPANNGGKVGGGLSRAAQLAQKHHESLYGKAEN